MHSLKSMDSWFFTKPGFYVFFIPIAVPYKKIHAAADSAGMKMKEAFGPIIERGKMFGYGWIGVEVDPPASRRSDVVRIKGDFQMYEHRGPYRDIGKAYKKIRNEYPGSREYFNFYLDDPDKVAPQDLRTQILFR